ncbi:hypothetical protein K445DRAFT_174238 [Daldinia sp. EC12]|nr:hypothetical protein K445DRAFT_174238 [Daldinia sp. EC12]
MKQPLLLRITHEQRWFFCFKIVFVAFILILKMTDSLYASLSSSQLSGVTSGQITSHFQSIPRPSRNIYDIVYS